MPIKWKGNENSTNVFRTVGSGPEGPPGDPGDAGATLLSVFNGSVSTSSGSASALSLGVAYVDPSVIAGTKMVLEGVINPVGGGATTGANLVLINKTTGATVASVASTSAISTFVNVVLNRPSVATTYEVKLYVSNVTGVTSAAVANMARLRFY